MSLIADRSEHSPRSLIYYSQRDHRQEFESAIQNYKTGSHAPQDQGLEALVNHLFAQIHPQDKEGILAYLSQKSPEKLERFFAKIAKKRMLSPDRKSLKVQNALKDKLNLTLLFLSLQNSKEEPLNKHIELQQRLPCPVTEEEKKKQKEYLDSLAPESTRREAIDKYNKAKESLKTQRARVGTAVNSGLSLLFNLKDVNSLKKEISQILEEKKRVEDTFKKVEEQARTAGCGFMELYPAVAAYPAYPAAHSII